VISDSSCKQMAESIMRKVIELEPTCFSDALPMDVHLVLTMQNIDKAMKSPHGYRQTYEYARSEKDTWRIYWAILLEHVDELQRTKLWKILE
jgi:hypothetical protein